MDDLVEHVVALPGHELLLLAPRDGESLLSEEAFEQEEFLPYWAELWPSALALARVVARRPLTGRRTIELGCGLGLPAIAAAVAGARVLATDWSPDSVAMTARNAERNGVELEARPFRWDAAPEELGPPWPLVLALGRPLRGAQRRAAAGTAAAPDRRVGRGLAGRPGPRPGGRLPRIRRRALADRHDPPRRPGPRHRPPPPNLTRCQPRFRFSARGRP